jgi:3'(2'), 5'-bisphosphate nucleotidase
MFPSFSFFRRQRMEQSKIDELFALIEKNNDIVIFGHIYPDGDCYGASEGLKAALQEFYPQKNVQVSSTDWGSAPDTFPHADFVSDEMISKSLHIIVDLPDTKRAGDKRAFSIKGTGMVKIDHHFFSEDFGGLEIIDENRASVSDFLASIFYARYPHLPKNAASLFYLGLTTDSGRFQFSYSPEVFSIASKLIEDGADVPSIYESIYVVSEASVQFKGYLFSNYQKTFLGVSYCKVPYEVSRKYGYDGHGAALCVNTIGNIEDSHCTVVFGEDRDGKVYCELRSKGTEIDVHQIAVSFGGGGHFNASGCLLKDMSEADKVIAACEQAVLETYPYWRELQCLLGLAQKSSEKIMEIYNKGFNVTLKSDHSPVTDADLASDKIIREGILSAFPDYGLLTEEDADDFKRLAKDKVFIIDPLDGTADFVRRDGQFAINLALSNHGEPVVGVVAIPTTGDIYFAVKGHGAFLKSPDKMLKRIHVSYRQHNLIVLASVCFPNPNLDAQIDKHASMIRERRRWGSAWKECLIAEGKADLCYSTGSGTKEWDVCAPHLVITEAGGVFTDCNGQPITYNKKDVYNRNGYIAANMAANCLLSPEEVKAGQPEPKAR